jgi:hypothetical protein
MDHGETHGHKKRIRGEVANRNRPSLLGRTIDAHCEGVAPDKMSGRRRAGVEGNARLTASVAATLFALLAIEGVTILRIGNLLSEHVFIGVMLIPVVVVKIASTGWRFVKYYGGDANYRRKGPPVLVLRLLGPVVIALTVVLLASGVGLVLLPASFRQELFFVHRASFILWLVVMSVHVLGHLGETMRLGSRDWLRRSRREVAGATTRQWALAWSLVTGVLLAVSTTPYAYGWFSR